MIDLTRERIDRGYTVRGLSRHLGIAEQTIRRLEDGETVHPAKAKIVADFFGVRVTDLMPVASREASST